MRPRTTNLAAAKIDERRAIAPRAPLTYKSSGVDIDAGNALVEAIKPLARATARPGVLGGLGGFGAIFDPKAAGFVDPLLIACTDGVGTKLKVAIAAGRHGSVGIDLVAMCVNDLVVQGAEPLFFLDYYATGRLDPAQGAEIVAGIAEGCRQAGCALTGGETAEMPGLYGAGDYDLAGFAVGAVERDLLLDGSGVAAGDLILGLASSGLHSNGFSLARKVVEASGLDYGAAAPFPTERTCTDRMSTEDALSERTLAEVLLTPTRIYVASCLAAIRAGGVKALAHITGGGLPENLPRVLPEGLCAEISAAAWPRPAVFDWLAKVGAIPAEDLWRTFNCGIGMAVIVDPARAEALSEILRKAGEEVYGIGRILPRGEGPSVKIAGEPSQ